MSTEKILKAYRVIREMLADRKILNNDDIIFDDILLKIKKNNEKIIINLNNVRIMFYLPNNNKIKEIKDMIDDNLAYDLYILVCKNDSTQLYNKVEIKYKLQIFNINELQFNISKHKLVPKHEIIDDNSIKDIISYYNLKSITQLPVILKSDPMAKYLNLKLGEVVKITRVNQTSGETISWRVCM